MINEIEYISNTGRVILREGTVVRFSLPGDIFLTRSTKEEDAIALSHSMFMQEFSKGYHIKRSNITSLKIDGVPQAIPGDIDSLIELLSDSFFLVTNPLISSNETRITTLETQLLKVTNFEIIPGATGAITIPTNGTILLDEFEGVVDAIVSKIDGSNTPTWESPRTAGGTLITVTSFDTGGNYVLSGTPTGNVALIYVYSVARKDFNISNSIGFETLNLTEEQILTGYNNQVDVVTQPEAEAGTSTDVKRWTPERIKQAILALGGVSSDELVKTTITDATPSYLKDKFLNNLETYYLNTFSANQQMITGLRDRVKPYTAGTDPTVNDDLSVLDGLAPSAPIHSIGQLWINILTTPAQVYIAKDLTIGAAVWEPLLTIDQLVKVSASDTTGGYLKDKIATSDDLSEFVLNPAANEELRMNLFPYNKVWYSSIDPNNGNDDSVPNRHRIGQIWNNTTSGNFFIAQSLVTGAAIWLPLQTIVSSLDPTPLDDGWVIGQKWYNTTNKRMWVCEGNIAANAYWMPLFDKLRFKAFNNIGQDMNVLGAGTLITFASDTVNEPNFLGIVHTANTSSIQVKVAGVYRISYSISYQLLTGTRQNIDAVLNINGTPNWTFDSLSYVRTADTWGNNRAESDVVLAVDDIIELNAFRIGSAGTNLTYTPATYIEIELIKRS